MVGKPKPFILKHSSTKFEIGDVNPDDTHTSILFFKKNRNSLRIFCREGRDSNPRYSYPYTTFPG